MNNFRPDSKNAGSTPQINILDDVNQQGQVLLPVGDDFLSAYFDRAGPDLMVHTPKGNQFVVPDYFAAEKSPDLITSNGGIFTSDLVVKLAGPIVPMMTVQTQKNSVLDPALGTPIGAVTELEGQVQVTHADGSQVRLITGDSIFQGDVVETSAASSIGVVFADDTIFSLGDDARMVMDEMVFDPDEQIGSFNATILTGTFSFVSGQIAKTSPDAMTLATPTATIGIRGSTGLGSAGPEGTDNKITLVRDVNGTLGELAVTTQGGVQVLNQDNASTTIKSAFDPPGAVVFLSQQDIQQEFGSTFTVLTKTVAKQAKAKAQNAQEDAETAKIEAEQSKKEAQQAEEDAVKAEDQAVQAKQEAQVINEEAQKAEEEAAKAEVEAEQAQADAELAKAEAEAAKRRPRQQAIKRLWLKPKLRQLKPLRPKPMPQMPKHRRKCKPNKHKM